MERKEPQQSYSLTSNSQHHRAANPSSLFSVVSSGKPKPPPPLRKTSSLIREGSNNKILPRVVHQEDDDFPPPPEEVHLHQIRSRSESPFLSTFQARSPLPPPPPTHLSDHHTLSTSSSPTPSLLACNTYSKNPATISCGLNGVVRSKYPLARSATTPVTALVDPSSCASTFTTSTRGLSSTDTSSSSSLPRRRNPDYDHDTTRTSAPRKERLLPYSQPSSPLPPPPTRTSSVRASSTSTRPLLRRGLSTGASFGKGSVTVVTLRKPPRLLDLDCLSQSLGFRVDVQSSNSSQEGVQKKSPIQAHNPSPSSSTLNSTPSRMNKGTPAVRDDDVPLYLREDDKKHLQQKQQLASPPAIMTSFLHNKQHKNHNEIKSPTLDSPQLPRTSRELSSSPPHPPYLKSTASSQNQALEINLKHQQEEKLILSPSPSLQSHLRSQQDQKPTSSSSPLNNSQIILANKTSRSAASRTTSPSTMSSSFSPNVSSYLRMTSPTRPVSNMSFADAYSSFTESYYSALGNTSSLSRRSKNSPTATSASMTDDDDYASVKKKKDKECLNGHSIEQQRQSTHRNSPTSSSSSSVLTAPSSVKSVGGKTKDVEVEMKYLDSLLSYIEGELTSLSIPTEKEEKDNDTTLATDSHSSGVTNCHFTHRIGGEIRGKIISQASTSSSTSCHQASNHIHHHFTHHYPSSTSSTTCPSSSVPGGVGIIGLKSPPNSFTISTPTTTSLASQDDSCPSPLNLSPSYSGISSSSSSPSTPSASSSSPSPLAFLERERMSDHISSGKSSLSSSQMKMHSEGRGGGGDDNTDQIRLQQLGKEEESAQRHRLSSPLPLLTVNACNNQKTPPSTLNSNVSSPSYDKRGCDVIGHNDCGRPYSTAASSLPDSDEVDQSGIIKRSVTPSSPLKTTKTMMGGVVASIFRREKNDHSGNKEGKEEVLQGGREGDHHHYHHQMEDHHHSIHPDEIGEEQRKKTVASFSSSHPSHHQSSGDHLPHDLHGSSCNPPPPPPKPDDDDDHPASPSSFPSTTLNNNRNYNYNNPSTCLTSSSLSTTAVTAVSSFSSSSKETTTKEREESKAEENDDGSSGHDDPNAPLLLGQQRRKEQRQSSSTSSGRHKSHSLNDSADTVIDDEEGGMSSSADFSDDVQHGRTIGGSSSKGNFTGSEDDEVEGEDDDEDRRLEEEAEDMDEGIQCPDGDNQLLSFNQMTVQEIEAFLRKYRKSEPLKDEGCDSILFLPDFINCVMEFLVKHGLKKQGIFRRPGVKSRIDVLFSCSNASSLNVTTTTLNQSIGGRKDQHRQPKDRDQSFNTTTTSIASQQSQEAILEDACVYDVADFLKGWFRKQEPLLSSSTVSSLVTLIGNHDPHMLDLNALRSHLLVLPNRLALETLLRFLSKFSSKSDYNNMSASNLAIVWTPSICEDFVLHSPSSPSKGNGFSGSVNISQLSSGASHASLVEISNFMKGARTIIEFLILNVDLVFSVPKSDLESLSTASLPRSMSTTASSLGPSIPAIGYRVSKVIHASPYEVFLKIVIERVSWDPLMTSSVDEGQTQRIRHSFSRFLPNPGSIRIQRKLVTSPTPSDATIQIHEESVDDSRVYCCDWVITKVSSSSSPGNSSSSASASSPSCSEVTLSFYCDLKGRPFVWYKKSYPKLLDVYLSRISESFPPPPGRKADRADGGGGGGPSDPFSCCFFMKTAVNA